MSSKNLTIEEVEQAFQNWRANKANPAESIPTLLINQVKLLLKNYPVQKILTRLGITRSQAKNKGLLSKVIADKLKSSPTVQANSFVKLPISQFAIDSIQHHNSLSMQRGDIKLSINYPTNEQIQLFMHTILR
jgi:hypothetical protein